jgi:hypothetical protein
MRRLMSFTLSALALVLVVATSAHAQQDRYREGIQRCLKNWGSHPFDPDSPRYRVIEPKVSIFGIGGDIRDDTPTAAHELVFIRPNVSVMSKQDIELLNPNGWYCLERSVSVMAKVAIRLHCDAHLATTQEGVTVMGGGNRGVNVMGATSVEMVDCKSQ